MIPPVDYWYKRLDVMKEFASTLQDLEIKLALYPDDYLQLRKENQKALNQTKINIQYIKQEIATIEATERGEL